MSASTDVPIVLTGCGWVTPAASGSIATVLRALALSGSAQIAGADFHPVADSILADFPDLAIELKRDKDAWLPAVALELALRDASLGIPRTDPDRFGLVLGSSLAGQLGMIEFASEVRAQGPRFVSPIHFPRTVGNYAAGALARAYNFRGPNLTLAGGSASSLEAILAARDILIDGGADTVVAGGMERMSPEIAAGLAASLPGGTAPSEGACLFVLEKASAAVRRDVTPLAFVTISPNREIAGVDESLPSIQALDARLATTDDVQDILSVASQPRWGAIQVEHWIGHCPGAAGAAAVAAAIGAANGLSVPFVDSDRDSGNFVTFRQRSLKAGKTLTPTRKARIVADHCGTQVTLLDMNVPVSPERFDLSISV